MWIRPLGGPPAPDVAAAMAALDAAMCDEFGERYADECWGVSHFALPLRDKWQLSHIAGDATDRLVAFVVASRPSDERVHIHRVAVEAASRSAGLGARMIEICLAAAAACGASVLSLTVSASNPRVQDFYRRLGFEPLVDDELAAFAAEHGFFLVEGQLAHGTHPLLAMRRRLSPVSAC